MSRVSRADRDLFYASSLRPSPLAIAITGEMQVGTATDAVASIITNLVVWAQRKERNLGGAGLVVPRSESFWDTQGGRVVAAAINSALTALEVCGAVRIMPPSRSSARTVVATPTLLQRISDLTPFYPTATERTEPDLCPVSLNCIDGKRVALTDLTTYLAAEGLSKEHERQVAELAMLNQAGDKHTWFIPTQPGVAYGDLGRVTSAGTTLDKGALHMRRVFSNGGYLSHGGRYYSQVVGTMLSEHRPYLTVNGGATVGGDYKSVHPRIAYTLNGLAAPTDLYLVAPLPGSWQPPRSLLKCVLLTLLNGGGVAGVRAALVTSLEKRGRAWDLANHYGSAAGERPTDQHYTDQELALAIAATRAAHAPIVNWLAGDKLNGARLAFFESEMARLVMLDFAAHDWPLLVVHDGFRTAAELGDELAFSMAQAYKIVMGRALPPSCIEIGTTK